jgi:hypothetical protein
MKLAALALALFGIYSSDAQAIAFHCEAPNKYMVIQPRASRACLSGLAIRGRADEVICISRLSQALDQLEAGQTYDTCTEIAKDGSGKVVARVQFATGFGNE